MIILIFGIFLVLMGEYMNLNVPTGASQNSKKTYLGRIPSRDFWDEAYQLFLEFATPEELETDTLTRETLQKIIKTLGYE